MNKIFLLSLSVQNRVKLCSAGWLCMARCVGGYGQVSITIITSNRPGNCHGNCIILKYWQNVSKRYALIPSNAKGSPLAAVCWGLACIHQTLLNTVCQHWKEENVSGSDPISASEAENQLLLVPLTPVNEQKQQKQKSALLLMKEEMDKKGYSIHSHHKNGRKRQIINESIITWYLSLGKTWDMWKDFSHHPDEHTVTWLLWCW